MRRLLACGFALCLLGARTAAAQSPSDIRVLSTRSLERIPLPGIFTISVEAPALEAAVEIHTRSPGTIAAYLRQHPSSLCPQVEESRGAVRLNCTVSRIDAEVDREAGRTVLTIRELRGLPYGAGSSAPPLTFWNPTEAGLGSPCPGTTALARGECLLAEGKWAAARKEFEAAGLPAAAVRLGDLAARDRDIDRAIGWYRAAGSKGPFGQIAQARICEYLGTCFGTREATALFDVHGLPAPLRRDLVLRAARIEAFVGSPVEAARFLLAHMRTEGGESLCAEAPDLCQQIALASLRAARTSGGALIAFEFFRAIMPTPTSALGYRLASAAADLAADMGAPVYAANVLAAATGAVPKRDLDHHLLQTADLYLRGGDETRASAILDFARFRLDPQRFSSKPWKDLVARLSSPRAQEAIGTAVEADLVERTLAVDQLTEAELVLVQAREITAAAPH